MGQMGQSRSLGIFICMPDNREPDDDEINIFIFPLE